MRDSKIEWTHHTFNPWHGCQRVSPGCENCYAETFSKRLGRDLWGPKAERKPASESYWAQPFKWNDAAAKAGERHRVFCASMADVFEDRADLRTHRDRLWSLIGLTPHLDWLLLSKRPENMARMVPWASCPDSDLVCHAGKRDGIVCADGECDNENGIRGKPWPNVWLGTTVEDQRRAEERIPLLLAVPAAVRFLSCEPLLGPVNLTKVEDDELGAKWNALEMGIDWVIVGGESGNGARPFNAEWARAIVGQCKDHKAAVHVKQMGANVVDRNDRIDTLGDSDDPRDWPIFERDPLAAVEHNINGFREDHQGALVRLRLLDRAKGGDMSEWPEDLRVREYPVRK